MANKRHRGVKASRIKLEQHMSIAGIKSQAELARKIADNEGLDSEPKDLVNRVFRQKNVEHHSLERIAKALNIEAFKLYLTQNDQAILADSQVACMHQSAETKNESSPQIKKQTADTPTKSNKHTTKQRLQKPLIISVFTLFLLAFVATLIFSFYQSLPNVQLDSSGNSSVKNSLIYPSNKSLYPLARYIHKSQSIHRLGLVPEPLFEGFTVSKQALEEYEVDNIWILESIEQTRYLSLFIKHFDGENTTILSVINLNKNELNQSYAYISKRVLETMTQYNIRSAENNLDGIVSNKTKMQEARKITEARMLSEQFFSDANMTKALSELTSLSSQNAESLAIKCLIKVNTGWHENEKDSFEQAKSLCERALTLDGQHPFVLTTNALLLFRNGQFNTAAFAYKQILKQMPENIEGLLGQAQLNIHYYLENPANRNTSLEQAINLAQQAIVQDPNYWKSYHLLSNFFYLAKQPKHALTVIKKLTELITNQIILANGAIISLCQADLEQAQAYSNKMLAMDPYSYIAYETLFFVDAYQGRLQEALKNMEKAMSHFHEEGGLYLQWGQLADAHRWIKNNKQAIKYYEIALVEYQQDQSKNQTTKNDNVYSLYFQLALHKLKGTTINLSLLEQLSLFKPHDMPLAHQLKIAVMLLWQENKSEAVPIIKRVLNTCPIYAQSPDLALVASSTQSISN